MLYKGVILKRGVLAEPEDYLLENRFERLCSGFEELEETEKDLILNIADYVLQNKNTPSANPDQTEHLQIKRCI